MATTTTAANDVVQLLWSNDSANGSSGDGDSCRIFGEDGRKEAAAVLLVVMALLSVAGAVGCTALVHSLLTNRSGQLSRSTRSVHVSHSLLCLLYCVSALLGAVYTARLVWLGDAPMRITTCSLLSAPLIASGSAVSLAFNSLPIERLIVLFNLRREKRVERLLAVVIIAGTWSLGLAHIVFQSAVALSSSTRTVCYCYIPLLFDTADSRRTLIGLTCLAIALALGAFGATLFLWWRARWMWRRDGVNRALHPLQQRYVMSQMIKSTKTLLPTISVHCVCFVTAVAFIPFEVDWWTENRAPFTRYATFHAILFNCIVAAVPVAVYPFIMLHKSGRLAQSPLWSWPRRLLSGKAQQQDSDSHQDDVPLQIHLEYRYSADTAACVIEQFWRTRQRPTHVPTNERQKRKIRRMRPILQLKSGNQQLMSDE